MNDFAERVHSDASKEDTVDLTSLPPTYHGNCATGRRLVIECLIGAAIGCTFSATLVAVIRHFS